MTTAWLGFWSFYWLSFFSNYQYVIQNMKPISGIYLDLWLTQYNDSLTLLVAEGNWCKRKHSIRQQVTKQLLVNKFKKRWTFYFSVSGHYSIADQIILQCNQSMQK